MSQKSRLKSRDGGVNPCCLEPQSARTEPLDGPTLHTRSSCAVKPSWPQAWEQAAGRCSGGVTTKNGSLAPRDERLLRKTARTETATRPTSDRGGRGHELSAAFPAPCRPRTAPWQPAAPRPRACLDEEVVQCRCSSTRAVRGSRAVRRRAADGWIQSASERAPVLGFEILSCPPCARVYSPLPVGVGYGLYGLCCILHLRFFFKKNV